MLPTLVINRLSCLENNKLMQLAVENFEFMQSIYMRELEDLKGLVSFIPIYIYISMRFISISQLLMRNICLHIYMFRWSKKRRLSEMGFGREKTVYTYFAIASCSLFPHNSVMRLIIAKAAIIVTVADDFYDMEGSLPDLEILTDAVQRLIALNNHTNQALASQVLYVHALCTHELRENNYI